MPILSFNSGLSCIMPKYRFIRALEWDISSDQMLIFSLIIQYHWHISITGNCMRCMARGGHLLVRCDTCKILPEVNVRLLAGEVIIWQDKASLCFLSTSIIHLWSILHSLKLEFYLRILSDEGKVVMSYLPPSVVKLATYLIDPLNYNGSRANK